MQSASDRHADRLRQLLRDGPESARSLASALNVSQPTVSRALLAMGDDVVSFGAARSIRYSLRDESRPLQQQPIYRVDTDGRMRPLGQLVPVKPVGFVMQQTDGGNLHSDGLPWWLFDMRPQGYLGRAFCRHHGPVLALPETLSAWGDSHVMAALVQQGADLPGNLLVGELAHRQFINAPAPVAISRPDKPRAYARLAAAAARGDVAGASAAGEQPKFTAFVQTDHGGVQAAPAHVIVKFSELADSPVSERWRDLLLAEHLAMQVLAQAGIAVARTAIVDHAGQRFLEVERFDRVGSLGRRALHSLAALDAEFVGSAGRWPDIAQALCKEKCIKPEAVKAVQLLWAYGHLIGNTDMHAGNLSFMAEHGRPYDLAPAYDMTPMAFAPQTGGGLPQDMPAPHVAEQVSPVAWQQALPLAQRYVQAVQQNKGWSPRFEPCIAALQAHVEGAMWRIERLA